MKVRGMTATSLGEVAAVFLGSPLEREVPLEGLKLDLYHPELRFAYEYDGPEHYCEVGHIERDVKKDEVCRARGITLRRWPYYFQLTKDVARHFWPDQYTEERFKRAITLAYGARNESEVLAPGLHDSRNTPANFVFRGATRFLREIDDAPASVRSQVVRSFQIYLGRLGPGREWLLLPEQDDRFKQFMSHEPIESHLTCQFPNALKVTAGVAATGRVRSTTRRSQARNHLSE